MKSQMDAEGIEKRIIYCHICKGRLLEIYSDDRRIVQMKYLKMMSLAYYPLGDPNSCEFRYPPTAFC